MKLRQLQLVREVARRKYNISAAAQALHTTQPGVSNQIHLLEQELGILIFERHGKRLTGITPIGVVILRMIERILQEVNNIKEVSAEATDDRQGILSIATTHTQARYILPLVIKTFRDCYPNVRLKMFQGTPPQIAEMAATGVVDLAIATEAIESFEELILLPCYNWNRSVIVPPEHPLLTCQPLTLEAVAQYPIVTYVFGFTGRSKLDKAFTSKGLIPNVVLTATDADVIKTYLHLGLGIGIIASMAFDPIQDAPLKAIDASHLFEPSTTHIGIRRGVYLRGYIYAFIKLFTPQLTREVIDAAIHS
ncbi:CysB family transcriptional regulator [Candidatus Nitrosoglobus terrae]|uniref:CysB family transcriptional regulator n=1 Tax=Candidatus Nitrosoglobus terrae TaxID=1630141 RepID=A0A1Q2SLP8_9GAMM|nr:HTH-type transcriptional regulator CysB [Candidatus Nitrosoglobus terrae]BAW80058.1 CysB family transcriptional regulator [Candidatus Nitrosoglobus terrae]